MDFDFDCRALLSVFLHVVLEKLAFTEILDFFRARKLDHKLLNKLKTKLNSIDSLVDDAERKQFTDPHIRKWLLKVKDAVFDAEDLLDDIQKLSKREVNSESEPQSTSGCTFKVLNFFKSSPISSFDQEIESRMQEVIDNLEYLLSQKGYLGSKTTRGDRYGLSNERPQKFPSTSLDVGTDIYGKDHVKEKILDWLISKNNDPNPLSILSIVGMGGVGKTTLAQHVYNDPRVNEAKFDVKAWVYVSDEFDVFKVSKTILEVVTMSIDDSRDLEMVHRRLKKELSEKRFLLVLDDVWNKNKFKWEELREPLLSGAQGSKILVTTRNKDVACTMQSEELSLELLQEDDGWKLFAEHAFRDYDIQSYAEFREIGMKIVKQCKGLPITLKTIGSLLYNKASVSEWESVFQSEIWEFSQEHCDIIPALALSYIHLPSHLKICFAYCALLPKDYEFKKEHLMHLWMTENLLHYCQHSKTPEEVCEGYFNDLLSRSFLQKSSKKELFVIHDLLIDLAKYVGGDMYFKWKVDKEEKIQKETCHFSVDLGSNQYFDGFGTLCNIERLRTFMPTGRSIDYFSHWSINMLINELFSKFKFLRILSLSHCSDIKEVPDSIGNLEYLRSLDLSNTTIKKLTEKICSLSHLQILKLNYCTKLEELPSNLHLLTNLCRLEFMKTKVRKVPLHLEKLKNLKVVINSFNVGHGIDFGIQRLGELNLEGSLSIEELQNIENPLHALQADLGNKTFLEKIKLRWGGDRNSVNSEKEGGVIENLQPSKELKELSIFSYGGKQFPNWLLENSLRNMVLLELDECESCQRLPPLGLLLLLKVLKIRKLDGIVRIDADFHGNTSSSFKSLKTLEFSDMSQWEKWDCQAVIGAFPRLQHLSISSCPKLKGHLPEQFVPLKTLRITDCQGLQSSAPRALDLELRDCGNLQLNWATMKRLKMGGHNMEASLLEIVGSDTLQHLHIYSVSKPTGDGYVSLWTFPLDFFPTLRTLNLSGFGNLQIISQDDVHNHLDDLTIKNCPKFESLPANMHTLLPSLSWLYLEDCPRLKSFPDRGLPSNLYDITLNNCSRLVDSLKFRDRSTLKRLSIKELDVECFPREALLPHSLTSLAIRDCPNLKTLNYKGLYQLSSLNSLVLVKCPNLQCLPEEGLPKSISYLCIDECPLLNRRCKKERGKDWKKIAHIQDLDIW
ncbi:putative disease resistance RPP13-like protein 1 [Vigna unguiculata]|uniref:putative disease resistance RPP13-like protein 1 n=1 Tax=Vigna unguiculata TaxID=3917 RepID=UPI001016E6BF|nr:putative disease resistance RPP13-like protein 1 [Vigna unguiculata]